MNINDLTYRQIKEISQIFNNEKPKQPDHPMLGQRCIVRTYSAGVHIGKVVWINPDNSMDCRLENALRLWSWKDGGLSLSAVANNGIKNGRIDKTGQVALTNAIEYIPTTKEAEETYVQFIEK